MQKFIKDRPLAELVFGKSQVKNKVWEKFLKKLDKEVEQKAFEFKKNYEKIH